MTRSRAIFWLSIALSGLAAAVAWSIPSLIAPRGGTATIGGIMNLLNNMFGVVAPITTGYIVGATHSFTGAFLLPASGGSSSPGWSRSRSAGHVMCRRQSDHALLRRTFARRQLP